ncbi:MAG: hypothetical protein KBD66_04150 [Candidatus Doudnabacteria bacterium]|nr:hypothetical protein [Candidatus Doudnabacteria bacterium]
MDRYDFVHFFIRNALGGTRNIDVPAARAQIERLKLPLSLVGAELEVITLSVRNGSQLTEEQMYRLEQMKAPLAEVEKNYFAIIEKYNLG